MLIFSFIAAPLALMVQPVLADSACALPEVEYCLFSTLNAKAPGTRVPATLTAYYDPLDTANMKMPSTCPGGPCIPSKRTTCPAICVDPQAYLTVFIRAQDKGGVRHHFLMEVPTASLRPVLDGNGNITSDPCNAFLESAKCKCRRDFAIANGLGSVPLCTVTDQAFQEELFLKFIGTTVIPALFPATSNAPFAIRSVSNYVIEDDFEPFYGIMDLVFAVQE